MKSTTDLWFASWLLTRGKKLENFDKTGPRRGRFYFDIKEDLIEKIMLYLKSNHEDVTLKQVENISEYIKSCPDEMIVNFFNLIIETKEIAMIRKFHKHLGKLVTEIVNSSDV